MSGLLTVSQMFVKLTAIHWSQSSFSFKAPISKFKELLVLHWETLLLIVSCAHGIPGISDIS